VLAKQTTVRYPLDNALLGGWHSGKRAKSTLEKNVGKIHDLPHGH